MTDEDLKKIQKLIKDEIRPVKETTEIIQSKVSGFDLYQRSTSINVRNVKDQLSVVNEKLDGMKEVIDQRISVSEQKIMKALDEKLDERITVSEKKIIKEIADFIDNHLLTQIDEKVEKHVTERLDNRVDHLAVQVNKYEGRLKKLEVSSNMASPAV